MVWQLLLRAIVKVGIPTWHGRISPVFDVASRLLVVETDGGMALERQEKPLHETQLRARAQHVARLGVGILICGAVSWPLEQMLVASGVQVVPQTCGPVEDILQAFLSGRLVDQAFLIPGCCGRRRRHGAGHAQDPTDSRKEGLS